MLAILGVSYRTLGFFVYPQDISINGELQSALALRMRVEIEEVRGAQEVRFLSDDATELVGLLVHRSHAVANLLLCHGYRRNKESLGGLIKLFPDYNIFLFDFRAHGESKGALTTIGFREIGDVNAAMSCFMYELARTYGAHLAELPRYILGFSMGAAAAISAAARNPGLCDALVADSSYADLFDEVRYFFARFSGLPTYPFLPLIEFLGRQMLGVSFEDVKPYMSVEALAMPVFIIHACNDEITPPCDALKIYRHGLAARRNVDLWIAPLARHARVYERYPEIYREKVMHFFTRARVA